jgi:hypothetical protein
MKAYEGVDLQTHVFVTSAIVKCEWSPSRSGSFTPGTHSIEGWVDPRAGLDTESIVKQPSIKPHMPEDSDLHLE